MNEVVALLADSSPFDEFEAPHVRAGAIALAKAVISRRGRLLVYADSSTMLQLMATATEYRTVQNVETSERRIPPIIVVGGLRSNSVEDRLIDYDRDTLGDLGELERYGLVESALGSSERGLAEAFERYSPIAVFLLGRGDRLSGVAEQALSRHRRAQMPLYSNIDVAWTRGWNRIVDQVATKDDWRPTLEGRFVVGEDAEIATRADNDARITLAVETIIDRLILDTHEIS
jgi:hypothetical protein